VPTGVIVIVEKVRSRSAHELENIFGEHIFNRLEGSARERNEVPLCMVINVDRIIFLERDGRNPFPGRYATTVPGNKICFVV
jgi:hypothetical protein